MPDDKPPVQHVLVPREAAASVAVRVRIILQAQQYIEEVCQRYAGLEEFENELAAHDVYDAVAAIVTKKASP